MLGSLMASLAVGHVYGLPGMANTAMTFLTLWGLEKYREFHFAHKMNQWLCVRVLIRGPVLLAILVWEKHRGVCFNAENDGVLIFTACVVPSPRSTLLSHCHTPIAATLGSQFALLPHWAV